MDKKEIAWPTTIFLCGYHLALMIGLPIYFYYYTPSLAIVVTTIVLYFVCGMSITGGYHRLYSHRAYKVHPLVEWPLLFFGTAAGQGSAIRWSHDHRIHHAHVDTYKDPYSIKKGFLYAHILWLFEKEKPIDSKLVKDLEKKPLLVFQHRHFEILFFLTNIVIFLAVGFATGDYVSSFVIVWWVRLFALHHSTWFINSLAHTWGARTYCKELSAVDNFAIALVTFGEGYHNYHHTFATDYRNGIRWYHFDPTKWMIWVLSKFGLARDLKSFDVYRIRKQMVREDQAILLKWIQELPHLNREMVEEKIQSAAKNLTDRISHLNSQLQEYQRCRRENPELLKQMKQEMRELHKAFRQEWQEWLLLSKSILNTQPLPV